MKAIPTFIFTALLGITPGLAMSAKNPEIIDRGMDMDTRYYTVACPDGNNTSIKVVFDINPDSMENKQEKPDIDGPIGGNKVSLPAVKQVCATGKDGKEKCRSKWKLRDAAAVICK